MATENGLRPVMTPCAARAAFRATLGGQICVHPASVFDPISARLAADAGFDIGMFAGSVASLTVLGAPDDILLTLSEFAQQARRICRVSPIPIFCDADHGYGNAMNVMRTVQELENAGVAGFSIEDTVLPLEYGAARNRAMISIDEGRDKLAAALAARQNPRLAIVGRTSAAALDSIEEAIVRLQAYEAVGVDGLFAIGVRTRNDLDQLSAATSLPLILGGVNADLMDLEYLASRRVRIALQGHQPFGAAVHAVDAAYRALRDGMAPSDLERIADSELMDRAQRRSAHEERVALFLGSKSADEPGRS